MEISKSNLFIHYVYSALPSNAMASWAVVTISSHQTGEEIESLMIFPCIASPRLSLASNSIYKCAFSEIGSQVVQASAVLNPSRAFFPLREGLTSSSRYTLRTFSSQTRLLQLPKMSGDIIHEPQNNRFILRLDGHEQAAFITYTPIDGGGVYDVDHTFTPPAMRGKGVAGKLVRKVISFARENELKIIPTCSYVVTYFERHPEDKDVLQG